MRAQLLQVAGHGHEIQSRHFLGVWAHARGLDGVAHEIGVRRAESGFRGGELDVVLAQLLKEGTDGLTWAGGSKSYTITSSRYAATCSKPLVTLLITFINQPGDALLP